MIYNLIVSFSYYIYIYSDVKIFIYDNLSKMMQNNFYVVK